MCAASFDHLVGELLEMHRDIEAQFLCGLDIEDQQELRWLLNWQISRIRALENPVDIGGTLSVRID